MTFKLWLLAGLALLLGLSASIYVNSSRNTEVVSGVELAAIELPSVDGSQVDIKALQGKLVLVNFWATWCPPCLQEIPVFLALRKKYAATGFEVLGVSIDSVSKVLQYRETLKINYPLLDGEKTGMALMRSLGNNIGGLPYSVMFDRDGRAVAVKSGAYQEQELIELIEKYR